MVTKKSALTAEQRAEVAAMIEAALDKNNQEWGEALTTGLDRAGKQLAKEFGNADS